MAFFMYKFNAVYISHNDYIYKFKLPYKGQSHANPQGKSKLYTRPWWRNFQNRLDDQRWLSNLKSTSRFPHHRILFIEPPHLQLWFSSSRYCPKSLVPSANGPGSHKHHIRGFRHPPLMLTPSRITERTRPISIFKESLRSKCLPLMMMRSRGMLSSR